MKYKCTPRITITRSCASSMAEKRTVRKKWISQTIPLQQYSSCLPNTVSVGLHWTIVKILVYVDHFKILIAYTAVIASSFVLDTAGVSKEFGN